MYSAGPSDRSVGQLQLRRTDQGWLAGGGEGGVGVSTSGLF